MNAFRQGLKEEGLRGRSERDVGHFSSVVLTISHGRDDLLLIAHRRSCILSQQLVLSPFKEEGNPPRDL